METWVILAIVGAFVQNIRTALQKKLTGELRVLGAAYTRFCYALPFAVAYVWWLGPAFEPNARFFGFALLGGLGQIAGTVWLLAAFESRNFAVATAISKTETIQTVLFGFLLLGEGVSALAFGGIAISLVGVWLLNPPGAVRFDRGLVNGLLSGLGFALAAIGYRGASLSLPDLPFHEQAACTLAAALTIQTLVLGAWLAMRSPGDLRAVARSWRVAIWVGLTGSVASACWFSAMALVNASYVRALGQVELVFSFVASVLVFRERTTRSEVVGVGVLCAGIVVLLLAEA
ncbi:MAG: DMT family transporter [Pseudomonadota bacterium]